jgi:hypothetical protein
MKLTRTVTVTHVVRRTVIPVRCCPHCGAALAALNSDMPDAREAVWIAMADLFLDTDVRMWYSHLARRLAAAPFTADELRQILDGEVTPVLQGNLLDIAGEWAGFSDEWVVKEIRANLGRPSTLLVNMDHHWTPVAQLVETLRRLPSGEILPRAQAWDALFPLFLYKDEQRRRSFPAQYSLADLERFFRQDLWPVLIDSVRRLARDHPANYPTEADVESNWASFAASF